MKDPMRVLLIAEAANPEWTSVPLVGWSHAVALSRITDAHIVTQVRNKEAFERSGLPASSYTCIDSEAVARRMHNVGEKLRGGAGKGWTTLMAAASVSYYYFEHLLWRQFGGRIRAREFDIIHRITPLSPTIPSMIAARCARAGVPFVVGPLNGGVPWPPAFDSERRREKEWLSYIRGMYKLLPGYNSMRRSAAAVLVGSQDTWMQVPRRYHDKCVYIPENAIEPDRFAMSVRGPVGPTVKAAFLGRLVPYKGADMLLEAGAPLIRAGKLSVDIVGDETEMARLKEMIQRESLASGVQLDGWVEHTKVQERLCRSDILAFPSIREFGGGVVLEAMALGLAPVIVNYGGPAELITPRTGIAVPIGNRSEVVASFRAALEGLVANPSTIRPMGAAARERVHRLFTWDAKAAQVLEVYRWVLGQRPSKPETSELFPEGAPMKAAR